MIRSPTGVTLIGAGAATGQELDEALALAPLLVAADGGADTALALGRSPDAVIGDLDSISDRARQTLGEHRLHRVAEQDSTDFAKALTRIAAPFVLALGFSGLRLDHTLAALHVMIRRGAAQTCVMIAAHDIVFAAPPRVSFDLPPGTRLSLFPMGDAEGRSSGLRWPIDGLRMAPDLRVGTSNEVTGPVTLEMRGPMLVMLPRRHLRQALHALLGPSFSPAG